MIFLLSSGCCSSLRWKKGEEEDRQEEGCEVESGEDQREERTLTWVAMQMGEVKVRRRLKLEPNVSMDEMCKRG